MHGYILMHVCGGMRTCLKPFILQAYTQIHNTYIYIYIYYIYMSCMGTYTAVPTICAYGSIFQTSRTACRLIWANSHLQVITLRPRLVLTNASSLDIELPPSRSGSFSEGLVSQLSYEASKRYYGMIYKRLNEGIYNRFIATLARSSK